MEKRWTKKMFGILAFFLLISASFVFYFFYNAEYNTSFINLSDDPNLQHVANKSFELVEDVFLYKFSGSDEFQISAAGSHSGIPSTIDDYLEYGDNFDQSEAYIKYTKGNPSKYTKDQIVGILTKGTKFKVTNIIQKRTRSGIDCYVAILNGPYKGVNSHIYLIYTSDFSIPHHLYVDSRFLKEVAPG